MIVFQRHAQTGFATTSQLEIEEVTVNAFATCTGGAESTPYAQGVATDHLMIWNDEDVCTFTMRQTRLGIPYHQT